MRSDSQRGPLQRARAASTQRCSPTARRRRAGRWRKGPAAAGRPRRAPRPRATPRNRARSHFVASLAPRCPRVFANEFPELREHGKAPGDRDGAGASSLTPGRASHWRGRRRLQPHAAHPCPPSRPGSEQRAAGGPRCGERWRSPRSIPDRQTGLSTGSIPGFIIRTRSGMWPETYCPSQARRPRP